MIALKIKKIQKSSNYFPHPSHHGSDVCAGLLCGGLLLFPLVLCRALQSSRIARNFFQSWRFSLKSLTFTFLQPMDEMNSRRWGGTSSPCFFSFDLFVFFPIAIALNLYLALYLFYSHFLHPAPCHEKAYFCLTVSTKFENNMTWRLLTLMFPTLSQANN